MRRRFHRSRSPRRLVRQGIWVLGFAVALGLLATWNTRETARCADLEATTCHRQLPVALERP